MRIFALALLLSIASGVLFGLLPARQIWPTDAARVMRGRSSPVLFRRFTLRDLLLGVQIALCTLLVTASLVAVRGMQRSLARRLAFSRRARCWQRPNADGRLLRRRLAAATKRILEEALGIPGVTAAGTINFTPLSGSGSSSGYYREGTTEFLRLTLPLARSTFPSLRAT